MITSKSSHLKKFVTSKSTTLKVGQFVNWTLQDGSLSKWVTSKISDLRKWVTSNCITSKWVTFKVGFLENDSLSKWRMLEVVYFNGTYFPKWKIVEVTKFLSGGFRGVFLNWPIFSKRTWLVSLFLLLLREIRIFRGKIRRSNWWELWEMISKKSSNNA